MTRFITEVAILAMFTFVVAVVGGLFYPNTIAGRVAAWYFGLIGA